MNPVNLFFYYIYSVGKKIRREREVNVFKKNMILGENSRFGERARVFNTRGKEFVKVGNYTVISGDLVTFGTRGKIEIGDYCFLGENSRIWSAKNVKIGNRVLISYNVSIHDNNSHPLNAQARHLDQINILEGKGILSDQLNEAEIIIEDDVWIGFNSTIMKGVKIGKGAIIGSNSIILNDVPEFAVVVGDATNIIKYTS